MNNADGDNKDMTNTECDNKEHNTVGDNKDMRSTECDNKEHCR